MKRNNFYVITLFIALICFGCTYVPDVNKESVSDNLQTEIQTSFEEVQEDTKPDVSANTDIPEENETDGPGKDTELDVSANVSLPVEDNMDIPALYEGDIMEFIDTITDDMLDACVEYPSLESYWNDPIVLLNKFNDDLRLYGITAMKDTVKEDAMLLYVQGEKVFVCYKYRNMYQELPKLNYSDIDSDGVEEIIISYRTASGSNISRYGLIVCDYEDAWNVYFYDDYLQDIEAAIQWQFDKESNTVFFMDQGGNILTEQVLPEWTSSYPFTGGINYEDRVSFDAETMLFCVKPGIGLENSLPYDPIEIVFHVVYKDGEFELGDYYIQNTQ